MVKFSIIIPTRKINDYLKNCINNILKQTYDDYEIIIVTEADENEEFDKTRILRVGRISPAIKRNKGVEISKGDIIVFIDDDAYPEKDWLENAIKHFKNKNIAAVGGPGIMPPESTFFQKISGLVYELSSKNTYYRYRKGNKVLEIDDYPTFNLFVRKEDFNNVNGFNSKYWGGEDTQLCYSLTQKLNKKIIYDPDVLVYHHRREKLTQHLKQSLFWGMWRGFFVKNFRETSLKISFFIPSLFLIWLILGAIGSFFNGIIFNIFVLSLIIYLVYLIYIGFKTKNLKYFFPVMFLSFLTHITYGFGFIKGLLSKEPTKKTFNPSDKK